MEKLIKDSFAILRESGNIEVVYGWMDLGDLICEKIRHDKPLSLEEHTLLDKLKTFTKRIQLLEDIILYRGLQGPFDPLLGEKQFSAMSPNIETAKTYGDHLVRIIVPQGSHCFYISAWELLKEDTEFQEEKEVLLPPGKYVYTVGEDGLETYIYQTIL